MASNYYAVLGLPVSASEANISTSLDREFLRASEAQLFPHGEADAETGLRELQKIRQTLLNPIMRREYDETIFKTGISGAGAGPADVLAGVEKTMHCSECGAALRNSAKFCSGCGASAKPEPIHSHPIASPLPTPTPQISPVMGSVISCSRCGRGVPQGQNFCAVCGNAATTNAGGANHGISVGAPLQSFSLSRPVQAVLPSWYGLSPYYQVEFSQIQTSGESYTGKWNWAAFCFGFIWALTKGLWLSALICIVISIATGGIGGFVYWFISGARGNYMFYRARTKGQQPLI